MCESRFLMGFFGVRNYAPGVPILRWLTNVDKQTTWRSRTRHYRGVGVVVFLVKPIFKKQVLREPRPCKFRCLLNINDDLELLKLANIVLNT